MMGEIVRNCRLCQEPMENSPFLLCATCLKESEQVWNFIKKNPYISIKDITDTTGVPFERVKRMINYGKERQMDSLNKQYR